MKRNDTMKLDDNNVKALTLLKGKIEDTKFDAKVPGFGVRLRRNGTEETTGSPRGIGGSHG